MKHKYVFFDIDGTIWDDQMVIPQSTIDAIRKLRENGHKAFLCTGRAKGNVTSPKLLEIGFDGIIAACGAYIEVDNQILKNELLPQDLVKRIVDTCQKNKMPVVLESATYHWISEQGFEDDPFVDYLWEDLGPWAKPMRGYETDMEINKFSADIIEGTNFEAIRQDLEQEMEILLHPHQVVEFLPKGISKSTGIQWVCDTYGISREDTYAIGDSVNDIEMLEFVGHGIAMGNASEETKAVADYVTEEIHHHGVYQALMHFCLL